MGGDFYIRTGGRQVGRTTSAIADAPPNAIYVCAYESEIPYIKGIAHNLQRHDLKFISAEQLRNNRRVLHGKDVDLIFDHAVADQIPERHYWEIVEIKKDYLERKAQED